MSFIYLASPYSAPDPALMHDRYMKALQATCAYIKVGKVIFSPIVHCHDMAIQHNMPKDVNFWWKYNRAMLSEASELWLLTLDDWKKSSGMRKEARFAIEHQIPISHVHYNEILAQA